MPKKDNYKYSMEFRERYGFNGADMHWMEEAFDLFAQKAADEVKKSALEGKTLMFTEDFFPQMFKDILWKARQWSNPTKKLMQDE